VIPYWALDSQKERSIWEPEQHGLRCPSDLTDAEWALAEPLIPLAKHGGRKRTVNVREVLKAMCYILSRIKVVLSRGYMMRRDFVKTIRGAAQSFPVIADAGGAIEVHFWGNCSPTPCNGDTVRAIPYVPNVNAPNATFNTAVNGT
jgi:hypothetical protein